MFTNVHESHFGYQNEMFNSCILPSKEKLGLNFSNNKSCDLSDNKIDQKSHSSENFFDYLNNICDSPLVSASKLSEEKLDLSNILQNIHLDTNYKSEDDNGSDKENEIGNLSLAELFFKGKKETSESFINQNENLNKEFCVKNSSRDDSSIIDDKNFHIEFPITNTKKNGFIQRTQDENLPFLFSDLLSTEQKKESKICDQIDLSDFEVDLNLAQKNSDEVYENLFTSSDYAQLTLLFPKKHKIIEKELPKAKESLFCKVLCCKVKKLSCKSAPIIPPKLPDLLLDINYYKYFTFDTPSPDDIIKEKQKDAFKKHKTYQ